MRVLCKMLRKEGFEVTEEYVVPTGFLGVWNLSLIHILFNSKCYSMDICSAVRLYSE